MELLTEYETTVIFRPDLGGASIEKSIDRIRSVVGEGGKLLGINHWGQKRLAYDIKKHRRGIYVHTQYLGKGAIVSEIERGLRLSEDVLRFLTIKLDEDLALDSRESQEYVAPDYESMNRQGQPAESDSSEQVNEEKAAHKESAASRDESDDKVETRAESGDEGSPVVEKPAQDASSDSSGKSE
jgi:small subunit ribosomal protein S6